MYSKENPVTEPVIVRLPANGLRLQFDGPEQRLRLIEVMDFTKNHITFKDQNTERDLVKPAIGQAGETPSEPTFRHIYHRFLGPTYGGEFIPGGGQGSGTYVLSYPGVAFTFPMAESAFSPDKDVVTLLTSSSNAATSMAIFSGDSWTQARDTLWTEVLPSVKSFTPLAKGKDVCPDEISLVKIHGAGKLQLLRKWSSNSLWICLGETTPQELIAEIGPPDAIYRKNDHRMYIHKMRTASNSRTRPNGNNDLKRQDDTDTDLSSAQTASEDSNDDEAIEEDFASNESGECFYNYFYLGFDVLVSTPTAPSQPPPTQNGSSAAPEKPTKADSPDRLVATKLVLHANVPGSYPFNRHRRCRWEISYLNGSSTAPIVNTETPFSDIEKHLREEWKSIYSSEDEARQRQRGMVLNRGWGDSPGSSCELLGGWEDSGGAIPGVGGKRSDGSEDSTTTLYGFPGLVFEVLKNGYVSALTVF